MTKEDERLRKLSEKTRSGEAIGPRSWVLRPGIKPVVRFLIGPKFARLLMLVSAGTVTFMVTNQAWSPGAVKVVGIVTIVMLTWAYWLSYAHRMDR